MACAIVVCSLIIGVEVGSVLSEGKPWIAAMSTCANNDNETSVPENETSWAGQARYNMSWGVVTLHIQETEEKKNCFAIVLSLLNNTDSSNETDCLPTLAGLLKSYLLNGTQGDTCSFAEFNNHSIKDLPTPSECMVNTGNSSEYVSCTNKFQSGCKEILKGNASRLRITMNFTPTSGGNCKNESCKEICSLVWLMEQNKFYLIVFGSLVLILDIVCICCCVKCQTRRQPFKREKDTGQEPVRRPYSEAIERIYINRDLSSQSTTYEVLTDKTQRPDTRLRIVQQNMAGDVTEASRSAKSHSGDYDLAWPGAGWSTTVSSPDVDYTHVEMMNKQTMDTLPEEEIYSKQKLVWEDGNDVMKISESKAAENDHKKSQTEAIKRVQTADSRSSVSAHYSLVKIVDRKRDVETADNQTSGDYIYSKVDVNRLQQRNVQEGNQGKNEKTVQSVQHLDNGNCVNNLTVRVNGSPYNELSVKTTQSQVTPKQSPGENGNSITESMTGMVTSPLASPVEELYRNLMKRDNISTTLSDAEAEKMVDEATAILMANMNTVLLETKL
uniref:Uncharacterized protein LOC111136068 isoform X2 n=1 Tax=Crassostrea virginica TaxID=6565 RepID=A0A8B8EQZ0_CRAVI|nr:uncharacterized protein LOC111136068 isoform X2 [Crassostrea virginica]